MRKALIPAFLLVLGSLVLGATVLREPIANATNPFTNVIIGNDAAHPVPTREQNLDGSGNIKVHEQGTANVQLQGTPSVSVANGSLPTSQAGTPFATELDPGFLGPDTWDYTVPAGKRLVIDYLSANANVLSITGGPIDWITLDAGPYSGPGAIGPHRYSFLMKHSQVDPNELFLEQPFDLVLNAGQFVSNETHIQSLILSGWLLDA